MNEKQFEKYLEKTMDKVHREIEKFYKKYPEYNTGCADGYLSLTFFKDRMSLVNSANADKRLSFYKERENGKWRKL
jgi:frataxin-like iron-binding protein CyaY